MAAAKNNVRNFFLVAGCGSLLWAGSISPMIAASVPIVPTPKEDDDDDVKPKAPAPKPSYVRNYTTPEKPNTAPGSTTPGTTTTSTTTSSTTQTTDSTKTAGDTDASKQASTTSTSTTSSTTTTTSVAPERPVNPAILPMLTYAYEKMRQGQFDGAVSTLCEAVRTDASSVAARRYLAYALLRVNEPLDAIQQLGLITKMTKPTTFDLYSLGEAYYTLGDYRQALDNYNSALATNSTYDAARGGSIKSLAMMGKYDDASKLCVEGLQKAKDTKAQTYYRQLYNLIAAEKAAPQQQIIYSSTSPVTGSTGEWKSVSTPEWTTTAPEQTSVAQPGVAPVVTPGVAPVVQQSH